MFIQANVVSMYPSIKIQDGLKTLDNELEEHHYKPTDKALILKTTEWVLRNNYMTFNNEIYLQRDGTAMGSSLSVTYACLYMAH